MIKLFSLLVAGAGMLFGLAGAVFSDHPYEVTGYFLSAEGVVPENDVVINGARVGRVVSVGLAPDGSSSGAAAVIKMQIDKSSAPLRRGTRALIRPKGMLGNMFVELAPVPGTAVIPSGGTLPLQDTAAPVALDQVMDIFDAQTQARVRTLTREGGAGLQNRGSDINTFIAALPSITQDMAALTAKLAERDRELDALDVQFDRIAEMMARESVAMRHDIASSARLLDTMAAHQQSLRDQLTYADRALGALAAGLRGHEAELNQVLKQMPALLDVLRSLSDHSATSLAILNPCMGDIIQTLAEMRSAQSYRDANGDMLRVHPYIGKEGSDPTPIPCTGAP
jgi:virulence factor Mce-like protein